MCFSLPATDLERPCVLDDIGQTNLGLARIEEVEEKIDKLLNRERVRPLHDLDRGVARERISDVAPHATNRDFQLLIGYDDDMSHRFCAVA